MAYGRGQVTYDEDKGIYTSPIFDFHRQYNDIDNIIKPDRLIRVISYGRKCKDDYQREDGKLDAKTMLRSTTDMMSLWVSDVSPEKFYKEKTFEEAVHAYGEAIGVESAIDAYLCGVPISDLKA